MKLWLAGLMLESSNGPVVSGVVWFGQAHLVHIHGAPWLPVQHGNSNRRSVWSRKRWFRGDILAPIDILMIVAPWSYKLVSVSLEPTSPLLLGRDWLHEQMNFLWATPDFASYACIIYHNNYYIFCYVTLSGQTMIYPKDKKKAQTNN